MQADLPKGADSREDQPLCSYNVRRLGHLQAIALALLVQRVKIGLLQRAIANTTKQRSHVARLLLDRPFAAIDSLHRQIVPHMKRNGSICMD